MTEFLKQTAELTLRSGGVILPIAAALTVCVFMQAFDGRRAWRRR